MIALDTSIVVDYFSKEPALSKKTEKYFEEVRTHKGLISSTLFAELAFHLDKRQGPQAALETTAFLEEYPIRIEVCQ